MFHGTFTSCLWLGGLPGPGVGPCPSERGLSENSVPQVNQGLRCWSLKGISRNDSWLVSKLPLALMAKPPCCLDFPMPGRSPNLISVSPVKRQGPQLLGLAVS